MDLVPLKVNILEFTAICIENNNNENGACSMLAANKILNRVSAVAELVLVGGSVHDDAA